MAARSTNTFPEMLQRLMADLGQAKMLPDVDPDSLTLIVNLENQILAFTHKPVDQAQADGAFGPASTGMSGQGGAPSGQGQGGVPGVGMMAGPPNPDELRRVLAGPQ